MTYDSQIDPDPTAEETSAFYQRQSRERKDALELVVAGWKWRMLPDGTRGWNNEEYLSDDQLRQVLDACGAPLPSELL